VFALLATRPPIPGYVQHEKLLLEALSPIAYPFYRRTFSPGTKRDWLVPIRSSPMYFFLDPTFPFGVFNIMAQLQTLCRRLNVRLIFFHSFF